MQSHYIHSGDIRLHYRSAGSGRPLICLHGITDDSNCWPLFEEMTDEWELILPDARGHGKSDWAEDYSVNAHAEDLKNLIVECDLVDPVVLGHSMGGRVAAHAAASYPVLLKAIILEDPAWFYSDHLKGDARTTYIDNWKKTIELNKGKSTDEIIEVGMAEENWHDAEYLPWAKAKQTVDPNVVHFIDEWYDWKKTLGKIQCQVQLITGNTEKGALVSEKMAEEAAALNDKISHAEVYNAGHCIRRDKYTPFMNAVLDFLDSL